jgi:hypothetical protein
MRSISERVSEKSAAPDAPLGKGLKKHANLVAKPVGNSSRMDEKFEIFDRWIRIFQ